MKVKTAKVKKSAPAPAPATALKESKGVIIDVDSDGNFVSAVDLAGNPLTGARLEAAKAEAARRQAADREEAANAAAKSKAAAPQGEDPTPGKKARAPKKGRERSVAQAARELVVAGKTNDEVYAALHEEFGLPESKRGYAAWYRNQCVKTGLVTKEFAKEHAGATGSLMPESVKTKLKAKSEERKKNAPSREEVRASKKMAQAMQKGGAKKKVKASKK